MVKKKENKARKVGCWGWKQQREVRGMEGWVKWDENALGAVGEVWLDGNAEGNGIGCCYVN